MSRLTQRGPKGLVIRELRSSDPPVIARAFAELGWNKPVTQYETYLREQEEGRRAVRIATLAGMFAGYLTIVWETAYPPFRERGIPEIKDLNVLPEYRRRRIATTLMDEAEALIAKRSPIAGIGVGLYADYGAAQRLYVKRGYMPDGRGVYTGSDWPDPGTVISLDDSATLQLEKRLER